MVEGIFYGTIAAIVSFLIFIPVIGFLSPHLNNFIPEFDLQAYFKAKFLTLFLYQAIFCIGLGVLSSIIAIRRYLHF
jgi:cell division protein FtsX